MTESADCWYQLDENDRITEVSSGFDEFARQNGGVPNFSRQVLGRSLWDFVQGKALRLLLDMTFKRAQQGTVRLPIRCDSPDQLRLLEMQVTPERRVSFASIRQESRVYPMEVGLDTIVCLCSWCNTFETSQGWLPLEQACQHLGLLQGPQEISHGMCPLCEQAFETLDSSHLQGGFREPPGF